MTVDTDQLLEQLLPHVMKFVGSSGGGQWRFQLLCSIPKCRRMDTISASARTIKNERYRIDACRKFIRAGWKFGNAPICPACRRAIAEEPADAVDESASHR